MPLSEIKRNIEEASRKEAKAMRDSAEKEREAILNEASEKVKAIRNAADLALNEEIARLENEYRSSAELERKNVMLAAREVALKSDMNGMRAALVKRMRANPKYERLFKTAIKNAVSLYPQKDFTVVMSKSDAKFLPSKGFKVEYGKVNGLMIYSKDRSVSIDATLEKLIESRLADIKSVMLEHMPVHDSKAKPARKASNVKKRTSKKPKRSKKVRKKRKG